MKYTAAFFSSLFAFFLTPAFATEEVAGLAKPWQLNFTQPVSPVMEQLDTAHYLLLILITLISLFVLCALVYICIRFNRRANPIPSKNAHNTKLEIIWTVIPVIILIAIAIPSLRLHYFMEDDADAEMTLKVVGYQWYWHYEYPDQGSFGFDSYMKKKEDLAEGDVRQLAVDNRVVVPVDTKVRVLLTAGDVIHAWAVPAFGVKRDAMPGRLNSSWFKATKTGTYYGQCSELCGVGHGFMPIRVDVVEKDEFTAWVAAKQKEAGIDPASVKKPAVAEEDKPVPLTDPISAEKKDPAPEIEKQKKESSPKASTAPAKAKKEVMPKGEPVKAKKEKEKAAEKKATEEKAPEASEDDEVWVEEGSGDDEEE